MCASWKAELGVSLLRRSAAARSSAGRRGLAGGARRILAEADQVKMNLIQPAAARAVDHHRRRLADARRSLAARLVRAVRQCLGRLSHRAARILYAHPVGLAGARPGRCRLPDQSGGIGRFRLASLYSEPFALVTAAPRRIPATVPVSALADIPLLMTRFHRSVVERQLGVVGGRLNIYAEIDSVESISELVMQGRWATVMPVSVFRRQREARTVALSEVIGVQLNRHS